MERKYHCKLCVLECWKAIEKFNATNGNTDIKGASEKG